MRIRPPKTEVIRCKEMKDNDTWNYCPECGRNWRDKIPTPGLLLQVKKCATCEVWDLEKAN